MNTEEEYNPQGVISALRFVWQRTLDIMSSEQHSELLEMVTTDIANLEALLSPSILFAPYVRPANG